MKRIGESARLHYDTDATVEVGDCIRTGTGRTYLVLEVRQQLRGKHAGRWHLTTLVIEAPPAGARRVHPLVWYPRGA